MARSISNSWIPSVIHCFLSRMRFLFALAFILLLPLSISAEEVGAEETEDVKVERGEIFFDPRISTDLRDVQTGIRVGDEEPLSFPTPWRLSLFFDAEFWPLPRGTRVRVAETQEYVIRKAWYALGPGVGAAWPLATWAEAMAAGGVSRSLGG